MSPPSALRVALAEIIRWLAGGRISVECALKIVEVLRREPIGSEDDVAEWIEKVLLSEFLDHQCSLSGSGTYSDLELLYAAERGLLGDFDMASSSVQGVFEKYLDCRDSNDSFGLSAELSEVAGVHIAPPVGRRREHIALGIANAFGRRNEKSRLNELMRGMPVETIAEKHAEAVLPYATGGIFSGRPHDTVLAHLLVELFAEDRPDE